MITRNFIFLSLAVCLGCASNHSTSAATGENAPTAEAPRSPAAWSSVTLEELTEEITVANCVSDKFVIRADATYSIVECEKTRSGTLKPDEFAILDRELRELVSVQNAEPDCHGAKHSQEDYIDLALNSGESVRVLSEDMRGICTRGDAARVRALQTHLRNFWASRGAATILRR